MRLPADMLFVPRWLELVRPLNPASRLFGDPEYPPGELTAAAVSPASLDAGWWRHGRAACSGEIKDQAQLSHEAQAARVARKARRAAEMWGGNGTRRMEARQGRRAAKEARRIMMARRQALIAAFTKDEV